MTQLDHLYRVALHLAKEPDDARDLVQESYASALNAWEQFARGTNMKAWLTKILYNHFFDYCKQRKRWASLEPQGGESKPHPSYPESMLAAENPGPERHLQHKELGAGIVAALAKIPEQFRAPVVLVDAAELSYAEAAEILSCPVGTVRSRLSRGRALLRKHLKGYR